MTRHHTASIRTAKRPRPPAALGNPVNGLYGLCLGDQPKRANNKNFGGKTMSLTKSTTSRGRVALFTSASTVAAGIAAAASLGALFMPGQALAQCMPAAPAPGPGADTITCPNSTTAYTPGGIVFTSSGDLTVRLTGAGNSNLGAGGLSLTAGNLDDDLAFTLDRGTATGSGSGSGNISGTGNTAPALVDLLSQAGDISVVLGDGQPGGGVAGNTNSVQYAVRARSTGAGDIGITLNGSQTISTGTGATNPGIAAIEATSNGGDITFLHDFNAAGTGGPNVTGRLYGLRALTTGAGNVTINSVERGWSTNLPLRQFQTGSLGIAAIDAAVGQGLLSIDLISGVSNSNSSGGIGIRSTTAGGNALINLRGGAITGAVAVEFNSAGGTSTINLHENTSIGGINSVVLRGIGDGQIALNNTGGQVSGVFRLESFDGDFEFSNDGAIDGWFSQGESVFSQGDNTLNNQAGAAMGFNNAVSGGASIRRTVLTFHDGADVFNNAGDLVIGMNSSTNNNRVGGVLEINGLDTFNNSGLIIMGSAAIGGSGSGAARFGQNTTDGHADDVLIMQDGVFHGAEGSRIWIDAVLNETGQTSCARKVEGLPEGVALANPADRFLVANDCMDFRGATVSGSTGIIISDTHPGDRGAYNPKGNVVVDVRGGVVESAQAFVISPETPNFAAIGPGIMDKGLFFYAIGFEAEESGEGGQFKIYGLEGQTAQMLPNLVQSLSEVWRGSTAPWIERRAAQRAGGEGGDLDKRFWLRGAASSVERTKLNTVLAGDTAYAFDNSYAQENRSLTFGGDLGSGSAMGGEWVLGAMVGYAHSELTYETIANTAKFEGAHVGLYGGFTAGGFFQDLVINGAWLDFDNDAPTLQLKSGGACPPNICSFADGATGDTRPILSTSTVSLGAHFETGWRFDAGAFHIEPLASVSWVRTEFGDLSIAADDPSRLGGEIEFDNARSLRAGAGLRIGMDDVAPTFMPIGVRLTAKAMEEWDGESTIRIENVGPDIAVLSDTFDGTFTELSGSVTLGDGSSHVVGFLNLGGVWAKDYEAKTGSVGVRVSW